MSNDWAALFRALTHDNGDNGDNGSPVVTAVTVVNVSEDKEQAALSPIAMALAALERRCPDHVEPRKWQHAVEDGRRFLLRWGEQAERLGWSAPDIFGLPPVPDEPRPDWQRLARVDLLGLVWFLHGRPVTFITTKSAAIATPHGGSLMFYRRTAGSPRRESDALHRGASAMTRAGRLPGIRSQRGDDTMTTTRTAPPTVEQIADRIALIQDDCTVQVIFDNARRYGASQADIKAAIDLAVTRLRAEAKAGFDHADALEASAETAVPAGREAEEAEVLCVYVQDRVRGPNEDDWYWVR